MKLRALHPLYTTVANRGRVNLAAVGELFQGDHSEGREAERRLDLQPRARIHLKEPKGGVAHVFGGLASAVSPNGLQEGAPVLHLEDPLNVSSYSTWL